MFDNSLGQFIQNFSRKKISTPFHVDSLDHSAGCYGSLKDPEIRPFGDVGQVFQLHTETCVRSVRTEPVHCLLIFHPFNGQVDLLFQDLLENVHHHAFHQSHHGLFIHECHLQVHLGKLGLSVSTQIFVPEAADNLIIAVKTGNHEELFEKLRGLRQGVEKAPVDPARDQVVPCPFRSALGQKRGLNLYKPFLVQILPDRRSDFVPFAQDTENLRSS